MGNSLKFVSETSGDLAKLVGYSEIIAAFSVSRSTVERAVKSGELLPPRKFKSRAVWLASDINAWAQALFDGQLKVLANSSVTNPEDLSPEQLESEAVALVVKAMEKRVGEPVDAADLGIHVTRRLSENQFLAAEKREFAIYSDRFSDFDVQRACVMAAWLFEGLRHIIEQSVPASNRPMYRDAETLELFGGAALHDDTWEEAMAAYRKLPGHLDA